MTNLLKYKDKLTGKEVKDIFYESGRSYELTLNPKKQYINQTNRIKSITKDVDALLLTLSDVADVELRPELSEPVHSNPDLKHHSRLHFHGILTLDKADTSAGLFLLNYISKIEQVGDYQFNDVEGDGHGYPSRKEYWNLYCEKQRHVMEPLYNKYKIPYIHKTLEDPTLLRLAKLEGSQRSTPRRR